MCTPFPLFDFSDKQNTRTIRSNRHDGVELIDSYDDGKRKTYCSRFHGTQKYPVVFLLRFDIYFRATHFEDEEFADKPQRIFHLFPGSGEECESSFECRNTGWGGGNRGNVFPVIDNAVFLSI
jgi:hypothetical protein